MLDCSLAYRASFQEHLLKRHCGHSGESISVPLLLLRSTGAQIILIEKKRTKCIKRPANSMKPKLLFEGRKRDGRRSSSLIVDEQMRIQLAAVVSFEKMTLLALTLSRKTRLFAFADYLFVLLQILSIRNYVSAFLKKANIGL